MIPGFPDSRIPCFKDSPDMFVQDTNLISFMYLQKTNMPSFPLTYVLFILPRET